MTNFIFTNLHIYVYNHEKSHKRKSLNHGKTKIFKDKSKRFIVFCLDFKFFLKLQFLNISYYIKRKKREVIPIFPRY